MAAHRAGNQVSASTTAPGWVPQGLTEEARADWLDLATATEEPATYDSAMTADLPEPVRRWLAHVIAPGTLLLTSVELSMRGQIRLGHRAAGDPVAAQAPRLPVDQIIEHTHG